MIWNSTSKTFNWLCELRGSLRILSHYLFFNFYLFCESQVHTKRSCLKNGDVSWCWILGCVSLHCSWQLDPSVGQPCKAIQQSLVVMHWLWKVNMVVNCVCVCVCQSLVFAFVVHSWSTESLKSVCKHLLVD